MRRGIPALPALVAAISALVVVGTALAASVPESPLAETVPGVQAPGALERLAENLAFPSSQRALMMLALVLLGVAAITFLVAVRLAWRGGITVRMAVGIGVLLHLLVFPAPILFSEDVFVYVMYGRIVSEHGANPYVSVPADFPDDPLVPDIGYRDDTSVYGPTFVALSAGVSTATSSTAAAVRTFKAIAVLSSLAAMLVAVASATRIRPERAAFAAVLIGWNPMVILHSVGGAHNDTIVALSLAAGGMLVLSSRFRAATLCLVLGVLVKPIVLVPLIVLAAGVVASTPKGRRLKVSATHAALAAGVFLTFAVPFLQAENPTLGLVPNSGRYLAGSGVVRGIAGAVGVGSIAEPLAQLAQWIGPLVILAMTVAVGFHLLRRGAAADPPAIVAGMGWMLLLVVTFSFTNLHFPWYGMWLVPLGWILPSAARSRVVLVSAALIMVHPWGYESNDWWIVWVFHGSRVVIGLILLTATIELARRLGRKTSVGSASALIDEGTPGLPVILAPLRWLDSVTPLRPSTLE